MSSIRSKLLLLTQYNRGYRQMSTAAVINRILRKAPPEFQLIPFIQEDMDKVMAEVPEFKFYYIGKSDGGVNPYSKVPLTRGIYVEGSEGKYEPVDTSVKFAKLENGLRIAGVDKGGCDSFLGLYVHAGSRFETVEELGVSAMLENMAYYSTAHLSHLRTIKTVETLGGNVSCNAFREHFSYHGECLRKDVPIMLNLLIGNVLFPRLLPWELTANKERLDAKRKQMLESPDAMVTEELHAVAWHNNTLGLPNYCPEASVPKYDPDLIRNYMLKHFSPDRMVFVGVNVDFDEMSKWIMRAFNEYNAIPHCDRPEVKPTYTGGIRFIPMANTPLLHLAVAYEIPNGGWSSAELVIFTVLQSLLGGGGSFSTGGPGKGMHSRLFLNVLNQHECVENCMAFNTVYSDTGLFGLYLVAIPNYAGTAVDILVNEFKRMNTVTQTELDRAKNSLKSFLWMSLEHKAIQVEDIARQLLLCNRVLSPQELEMAIDQVTIADIKGAVNSLVKGKRPSIVALGNLNHLPSQDSVLNAFKL
ncbi:bifunctional Peptidase M16 [Babesia duncani]|uniref:Bifunctional Peptidase M16 n=1 Tax=Babesia duncani TaxID=323732 RepID=A0AAD9PLE5_9APIC|nr:bifunctional Peptidase M16 [Babesia duncani]